MINVKTAKTAELVSFYNDHAGEIDVAPVKKFADRKTAERRVSKMVDALLEAKIEGEPVDESTCPECGENSGWSTTDFMEQIAQDEELSRQAAGGRLSNTMAAEFKMRRDEIRLLELDHECIACGHVFGKPNPHRKGSHSATRSAGIAKSWENAEVAVKRSTRHIAVVDGHEFRSVRQAFVAFQLPLNEHIKFRMELKAAGKLEAYGKTWEVKEA